MEWAEMADPNDPEWQARYRWLMNHLKTCTVCRWRNEDNSDGPFCADGERYFADPTFATSFGPAPLLRGDAVPLPGFESVATAAPEGTKSWSA